VPSLDEVRLFLWDHIPHEGGVGLNKEDEGRAVNLVCNGCGEFVPLGPDPVSTGERKRGS